MSPDSDLHRPQQAASKAKASKGNGAKASETQTGEVPQPKVRETAPTAPPNLSEYAEGPTGLTSRSSEPSEASTALPAELAAKEGSDTSGKTHSQAKGKTSAARTNGRKSSGPKSETDGGVEPGLRAGAKGGPATWIDASPGMPRSAEYISMTDRRIARGLGWFSLGLGIPQVLMPGRVNKLAGIENTLFKRQVMRLMGLREITSGVGIFTSQPKPAEWLWARSAGDAMDLLLLQSALRNPASRKGRLLFAMANVAGVAAADVTQARKHTEALKASGEEMALKGRSSITVNRPPEEVYRYWKDFENLPRFMLHLESVTPKGEDRYHWVARAPFDKKVEWDADVVDDIPNELIAWRSTENADVPNSGSVQFRPAPGDRGTEVIVEVDYQLPGGAIGDTVARLFGEEPQQQIKDDLRRFKQVVETGEVVLSDANPEGTAAKNQLPSRPAQPAF